MPGNRRGVRLAVMEDMFVVGLVLSLAIGVSLGLLGGGGSTLTVPVLHYVFGVSAHGAIASSLIVVGLTSMVAMVPHARAGHVRWRIGLVFGIASMAAALAGSRIGAALPGQVLLIAFAAVMVVSGIAMLLRTQRALAAPSHEPRMGRIVVLGAGVGLLTGVLGAGGGFIIVPALVIAGGLPVTSAVATSLLVIAMNSVAAYAGMAMHVDLEGGLIAPVVALAVIGTFAGTWIGRRMSPSQLQRSFAYFVIVLGLVIAIAELW